MAKKKQSRRAAYRDFEYDDEDNFLISKAISS